jgi:hypothetical protein
MCDLIFLDILNIIESSTSRDDLLHKFHTIFEPRIYEYFKIKYLNYFRQWWANYELPLVSSDKCIVLYETRCHNSLEFLIYNLTYFARGWGLIIYCSKANYNFINNILKHNRYRAVLHIVREDEGGREVREEYNEFTKSAEFWNSLPCKNILMCEMDGYLKQKIPNNVIDFDYVCCGWPWRKDLPGGGGISFRKVSSMKRICKECPDLSKEIFAQDSWAAEGCNRLHLSYNNSYLVEANHRIVDPIGFHNWWTFINPTVLSEQKHIYDSYLTLEL